MKKKLSKYWKIAVPFLALLAVFFLVAAVLRAVSIQKNEGTEGIEIPGRSLMRYLWLEIKSLFLLSRY